MTPDPIFQSEWPRGLGAVNATAQATLAYARGGGGGPASAAGAFCMNRIACIAVATMLATSVMLAGRTSAVERLASSPNCEMYCSATRSYIA